MERLEQIKIEKYEKALKDIKTELNKYCSEGWTTKAIEIVEKVLEDVN